jgi:hypothetical protein
VYVLPLRANESKDPATRNSARGKVGAALAKAIGGDNLPDPFTVTINMKEEFAEEANDQAHGVHISPLSDDARRDFHYGLDAFFPANKDLKFDKEWKQILGLIARRMKPVYGFKAAEKITATRTNFKVLAGPCGLKSSLVKDKQMRVCGPSNTSQCARALGFHEHFMNITKGERNYSVFDKATVDHINDLAKVF